jgi:hypothetical protein
MHYIRVALSILFVLLVFSVSNAESPRLALYLVELDNAIEPGTDGENAREYIDFYFKLDHAYVLEHGRIIGEPIFTNEDIIEYDWNNQYIIISREAAMRYPYWKEIPIVGQPAMMVVDGSPCYSVLLWPPFSSLGSYLPHMNHFDIEKVIEGQQYPAMQKLMLSRGCCLKDRQAWDVRLDERVKAVMKEQGKLVP